MNWNKGDILEKIDYKRVTPRQRARLEPHLQVQEVQDKLVLELAQVTRTIDIMSTRIRNCLTREWAQIFDTIVAERAQYLESLGKHRAHKATSPKKKSWIKW